VPPTPRIPDGFRTRDVEKGWSENDGGGITLAETRSWAEGRSKKKGVSVKG
jgi:hypothetical protein